MLSLILRLIFYKMYEQGEMYSKNQKTGDEDDINVTVKCV